MIAFATLLLGLISGVYPIEVTVGGAVTAVEFTLDGAPAARLDGPPWVARIDLGSDLRPRQLTARGLDADGKEIARVTQWLNLPRPPAEVDVVLENGADGRPKAAALAWQSVSGVKPVSIGLTLDGQPLTVDEHGRSALPASDLKVLHVLTAELWFPPGLLARKDVAFGGEYGSEVSSELTAVPVKVQQGTSLPPAEALQGWFAADGQALAVAAVEDGPGKVILVRLPSGTEMLSKLIPGRRRSGVSKSRDGVSLEKDDRVSSLRNEMRLGKEDKVRFLSLSSSPYKNSRVPAELFDMSRELTYQDGGLFWHLINSRVLADLEGQKRRIADAVAVAGLQAAAENYRRAVVLVLGGDEEDASRYDPETVRRYLKSIHVPLFVWSLYGAETPAAKRWGGAEDVSTVYKLSMAVARLRKEVEAQRIIWLEGRYLPQAIALSPSARGVDLPR
ncbi:MAG TPA: hypothetical protein VGX68_25355 [Thermoanaerobaculia bacterium]|jgi:hypothetical protein|nr:hypothetical protein [Thermoanaerobaculia bacterium]